MLMYQADVTISIMQIADYTIFISTQLKFCCVI